MKKLAIILSLILIVSLATTAIADTDLGFLQKMHKNQQEQVVVETVLKFQHSKFIAQAPFDFETISVGAQLPFDFLGQEFYTKPLLTLDYTPSGFSFGLGKEFNTQGFKFQLEASVDNPKLPQFSETSVGFNIGLLFSADNLFGGETT